MDICNLDGHTPEPAMLPPDTLREEKCMDTEAGMDVAGMDIVGMDIAEDTGAEGGRYGSSDCCCSCRSRAYRGYSLCWACLYKRGTDEQTDCDQ